MTCKPASVTGPKPADPVPRDVEAGPAPLSVLVVDDSASQRALLSAWLRKWGYSVSEAASGAEGLARCRAAAVDIVLSDWMMPGLSGVEFCRAFRALGRDSYGYFILLTSNSDRGAVAEGLDAGADDFLAKPVSADELRARLHAGVRILDMQAELTAKNRLVGDTLARLQAAHAALGRDLDQARLLQQSLLRERHRRFPGGEVSLMLRPSGHIGGDLVGFFRIDAARVGLYALDVSGHGVSSALLSARLAGLFSDAAPDQNLALRRRADGRLVPRPPTQIAARMNRVLLDEIRTDHYCTLAYAEVDLTSGALRLAQAGHPHPLIQRADGSVVALGRGGLPVGLFADAAWTGFAAHLHPGDRLVLLSDGFEECPGRDGRELGAEGLRRLVGRLADRRGAAFHEGLLAALSGHLHGSEFPDDVSCCLFERDGPGIGALPPQRVASASNSSSMPPGVGLRSGTGERL